ncbi:MAG: enoyl-CoA hydratase [Firmicutes bacterium]|nr:enoyl-CoA hydratase [Bacillota bacterium]
MPIHSSNVNKRPYNEIEIGETASITKSITEADIVNFAGITGDVNPMHVDIDYAQKSMFGERLAHGMLTASFISTVLGTCLPGKDALYLGQEVRFVKPVKIGDTITASAEVVAKEDQKQILTLKTIVTNQRGEIVVDGQARILIMRPKNIES